MISVSVFELWMIRHFSQIRQWKAVCVGGSPPVHIIPSYAPECSSSHIRDVREGKRAQRRKGRGKTGKEEEEEVCANPASGLGSSRKSYSQPLTLRIERERGETRRRAHERRRRRRRTRRRRGAAKTTMAIPRTSQPEIVSDHSAPLPPSTTAARSMQSHNRQSPDEWGAVPGPWTKWGSSSSKTPVSSQLSRLLDVSRWCWQRLGRRMRWTSQN